jgi:hypothetical protein
MQCFRKLERKNAVYVLIRPYPSLSVPIRLAGASRLSK